MGYPRPQRKACKRSLLKFMTALYLSLLITTLAMIALLSLVFFDMALRTVLPGNLYNRVFTMLAAVAVAGILFTTSIGFKSQANHSPQALLDNTSKRL
jgi:hypothetical protein